jgi:hypothetical protein
MLIAVVYYTVVTILGRHNHASCSPSCIDGQKLPLKQQPQCPHFVARQEQTFYLLQSLLLSAAGTRVNSTTATAAAAGSIGAVVLLLAAAAASVMYKHQQAAAVSKVMPHLGTESTPQIDQLVDSALPQFGGADGAELCVPATAPQVCLLTVRDAS